MTPLYSISDISGTLSLNEWSFLTPVKTKYFSMSEYTLNYLFRFFTAYSSKNIFYYPLIVSDWEVTKASFKIVLESVGFMTV